MKLSGSVLCELWKSILKDSCPFFPPILHSPAPNTDMVAGALPAILYYEDGGHILRRAVVTRKSLDPQRLHGVGILAQSILSLDFCDV